MNPLEPVVIHEDPHLLVLAKPSGLLSVPGLGPDKQDCLSRRVQARWPEAMIVHRLDMATSGLILMARGPDMHKTLSMAFEKRRVHKRYEAVVLGQPLATPDPAGWSRIDLPIRIDYLNRPRSIVDHERGKPSLTHWRSLGPGPWPGTTRLSLEPFTGRTHQLRVHLMTLGHPIVGDPLYAPPEGRTLAPRLLLHACELAFSHPVTRQDLHLSQA
ncbi:MAG: RluA family pseudouridine synthase, partial [Betaproteobacteria bacterium]|nr:RluA family pseudouridine synthase [Betaproteobacteria bacterium]